MTFTTASGSMYEVDKENSKIRRLVGVDDPTPRQGYDGEWKVFVSITDVELGYSVLVGWRYKEDGVTVEGTLTSPVVRIGQVLN